MKKKLTVLVIALFSSAIPLTSSFAQETQQTLTSNRMLKPDIIIKGEELKNFLNEISIHLVSKNSGHFQKNMNTDFPSKTLGIAINAKL